MIPSTMLLSIKKLRCVSVATGRRKNRAAMEEVVGEVRQQSRGENGDYPPSSVVGKYSFFCASGSSE